MRHALINLYVLLTSPIPVPWTLLYKGTAVILAYAGVRHFETFSSLDPINLAVLAGLLTSFGVNAPRVLANSQHVSSSAILSVPLALCAAVLFIPAPILPYAISGGLFILAAMYGLTLTFERPMIDQLGWRQEIWGIEGQSNAIRWTILRCVGLGVANAYAAKNFTQSEWLVCYAVLPLIFHALFHWTILATHPYEDQKTP